MARNILGMNYRYFIDFVALIRAFLLLLFLFFSSTWAFPSFLPSFLRFVLSHYVLLPISLYSSFPYLLTSGQAFYQLLVVFVLVFYGDVLMDVPSARDYTPEDEPTQHYTVVFNAFVWMQVCFEISLWLLILFDWSKLNYHKF
jgi:hypothetical protein